jgi:hypothetical protein
VHPFALLPEDDQELEAINADLIAEDTVRAVAAARA